MQPERLCDPLLQQDDNPLQEHYRRFQVSDRILLSGHSHQAWPDDALEGQTQAFSDAAQLVDDKWSAAFAQADLLRQNLSSLLQVPSQRIVLGASTHDLLLRFLSALPWKTGANIVTTDGEFHSMRRQLRRLQETGVKVKIIEVDPLETLARRMIQQIDSQTIAVMASLVMFQDGHVFRDVSQVVENASQRNVAALVDVYHAIGAFEFSASEFGLEDAFLVGGGYKYLQLGEGNCFLTLPKHQQGWTARPVVTGWFAEFAELENSTDQVGYGADHFAFAGSTYDPTSHYRANAVFRFFQQQGLTSKRLQQINRQQIGWLWEGLKKLQIESDLLNVPVDREPEDFGAFLALQSPFASEWVRRLRTKSVYCDARNDYLRLGPAPYVSREQIHQAIQIIAQLASAW